MSIVRPKEDGPEHHKPQKGFRKQNHRDMAEAVLQANPHLRN